MHLSVLPFMGVRAARALPAPTSIRRLGYLGLALWVGVCSAQGLTAQGVYPGDAAKDAFKLPYELEPVVRLRTYYKNTDTVSGAE